MENPLLDKSNTGIACEFLVAGELARRGFNVTLTLGNTKAIDLLIEKGGKLIPIQVKGIQRKKSICWNISLSKLGDRSLSKLGSESMIYVLVNLNSDTMDHPEYFILTEKEVKEHFKQTKSGRDYLDYNPDKKLDLMGRWDKI